MPKFHVKGYGRDTGRKREHDYAAHDEQTAILRAAEDGTVVESITQLPPKPATERQIDYARSLGITLPDNVTMDEISDLLDYKLENDRDPSEEQLQYATKIGIECTRFVGKKKLFNLIAVELRGAGKERTLLAWFAYRVARSLLKGEKHPLIAPESPLVMAAADSLLSNAAVLKSVRGYSGDSIIWFGEWTSPDGWSHSGGSKRTIAYQRFSEIFAPALKIDMTEPNSTSERPISASVGHPSDLRRKRKVVALLLCTFLGVLGVHRFYADRKISGLIMLMLTITLFGTIISIPWAIVDWLSILRGRFIDGYGKRIAS